MIVAGLGCKKGATEAEVLAAIRAALVAHQLNAGDIEALAVPEQKSDEPGIHAAAEELNLVMVVISRTNLEGAGQSTLSRSALSEEVTGAASASEAAALAAIGSAEKAAGRRGRLLGPRIAVGPVTCALASDGALA